MNVLHFYSVIFLIIATLAASNGGQAAASVSGVCGDEISTDRYWSEKEKACVPCTRCHDVRKITLIGCSPVKDTVCGTISDLRNKFLFKKKKDNKRSNGGGGGGGGGGVKRGHVEIGDVKIVAQPIATSEPEVTDDVVYGKAKYKAPRYQRRPYQPTRQVREKVKNEAQKKSEFLKSLQELEKIPVRPRKKKIDADLRGGRDGGGLAGVGAATSGDEVDGKIHFNVEENFRRGRGDLLHQDLELIEQKLFRENDDVATSTDSASNSMDNNKNSWLYTTTTRSTTQPPQLPTTSEIPMEEWFNGNKGMPEATRSPAASQNDNQDEDDDDAYVLTGDGSANYGYTDTDDDGKMFYEDAVAASDHAYAYKDNEPNVYGAIVQTPEGAVKAEADSNHPDEFGLLTSLLFRKDAKNIVSEKPSDSSKSSSDSDQSSSSNSYLEIKLSHIMVVVGFFIGFGLVFLVAIAYTKFHPKAPGRRSFKVLDNAHHNQGGTSGSGGDTSSLSSHNSSFLQTDSRLTSLAASPLLSQAQSPQPQNQRSPAGGSSPLQTLNREVCDPRVLNETDDGKLSPHSAYVDRRGRTVLRPSRELPV